MVAGAPLAATPAEPWVEPDAEPPASGWEAESCEPLPDWSPLPEPLPPVLPLPEPPDDPEEPDESPDPEEPEDPDEPEESDDPEDPDDPWSPPVDEPSPDDEPFDEVSFDESLSDESFEPDGDALSAEASDSLPFAGASDFWACDDEGTKDCGFAPTPCPVVTRLIMMADKATATMADTMDTTTTPRWSFFLRSRRSRARCTEGSPRRSASSARGVRERRAVSSGAVVPVGARRAVFSAGEAPGAVPDSPAACSESRVAACSEVCRAVAPSLATLPVGGT